MLHLQATYLEAMYFLSLFYKWQEREDGLDAGRVKLGGVRAMLCVTKAADKKEFTRKKDAAKARD